MADQTVQRMAEIMVRFTAYVERGHHVQLVKNIAEQHVEGFVFASLIGRPGRRRPAVATMHLRRTALRLYFRTAGQIGVHLADGAARLYLPPRTDLSMRPLTDDEVALCRSYSLRTLRSTRQPAAWALAEATAKPAEAANIRASHLHLGEGRVWIPDQSKPQGRWGYPSEWGLKQLRRRLAASPPNPGEDPPVAHSSKGSQESRRVSSSTAIEETLRRAGLFGERDIRPLSVTAWAGRKVFEETGRIEEVACRLGFRSLDRAARLICWDWAEEKTGAGPSSRA
ncbi:MAG: hypothetical protein ACR2FO_03940 [Actinomycetota bacterium]